MKKSILKQGELVHPMRLFLAVVLPILLSTSGCISQKSFVDPSYVKVRYEDLTRRAEPYKVQIIAEFQRNGTHFPSVDKELLATVERVVQKTGIVAPTTDSNAPQLKIIVNNIADRGSAAAKGFGTGASFGLIGSTVIDYYEMQVVLTRGDKLVSKGDYKHALYTTIGNASGPAGVEPTTPAAGFGVVVEQMLLNALKDMEQNLKAVSISQSWLAKLKAALQG